MLLHRLLEHALRFKPLGFIAAHAEVGGQVHRDAQIEGAEPDDVDVRDLGEDGVEVVDSGQRFDLDHDCGLVV